MPPRYRSFSPFLNRQWPGNGVSVWGIEGAGQINRGLRRRGGTASLAPVIRDSSQDPTIGKKKRLDKVFDFACGSGSLLLNVRNKLGAHGIGKIYGQEKNITTYNLARINMLLHGVKDSEFEIFHGDSLLNDWPMLKEANPAKKCILMQWWLTSPSAIVENLTKSWARISVSKTTGLLPNLPPISPSCCTAFCFAAAQKNAFVVSYWKTAT